MENIEILTLEELKKEIDADNIEVINQEQFDLIANKLIENDEREMLFYICAHYEDYNYNKIIDYFINVRDSRNLEEIVGIISSNDNLDQKYLTEKMLGTKDKAFIKNTLEECSNSMHYCIDEVFLKKLLDYINS